MSFKRLDLPVTLIFIAILVAMSVMTLLYKMAPNHALWSLALLWTTTLPAVAAVSVSRNGLGATPQMGWNNWNSAGCDSLSQQLILDNAQKMVDVGLRDVGYQYVVMDDCWSNGRTKNGTLSPNMTRFPDGIGPLADKIHAKNLKWGMYSSAGLYTCAEYEGSLGHETVDAQTFAGWGVDYLKYDNCYNQGQEGTSKLSYDRYKVMSDALNATGRPIWYGICNWGTDYTWNWAQNIANSWRIAGDIYDSFDRPDPRCPCQTWDCRLAGFHCSIMNILNKVAPIVDKGRIGGWNDLDALEVGNAGMSDTEYVAHMTMWAILKSPLILGNDLTLLDAPTLSIISNPAILAINQDPLGMSAFRVWEKPSSYLDSAASSSAALYVPNSLSFWTGQLNGGDQVIAFLNAGNKKEKMNAGYRDIFVDKVTTGSSKPSPLLKQSYEMWDLWGGRMDNNTASQLLKGNFTSVTGGNAQGWFNATAMSYKDAVSKNVTAVLGKKVGTLSPGKSVDVTVEKHGVVAYRLRSMGIVGGKSEL